MQLSTSRDVQLHRIPLPFARRTVNLTLGVVLPATRALFAADAMGRNCSSVTLKGAAVRRRPEDSLSSSESGSSRSEVASSASDMAFCTLARAAYNLGVYWDRWGISCSVGLMCWVGWVD